MIGADGDSRYNNTFNLRHQGFGWRQTLGVAGAEIDDQSDNGLTGEDTAADPEPADFDQTGQLARRPHHELPLDGLKVDAVITDQRCQR